MVREIVRPENTRMTIDIPENYVGRRVEYIVFPLENDEMSSHKRKRSLKGALHAYADPAKRELEERAWSEHLKKKYQAKNP
jgi:hypothetical protein